MANTTSNKGSAPGNVIYDSRNDMSTGKKRAVQMNGGVSVAERARMFGTQVTNSSAPKNPKPTNQRMQWPPVNNQSTTSNIDRQDRNYQPYKTDIDSRPKQQTYYSTPPNVQRDHQSPVESDDRFKRTQPPSSDSRNYSSLSRSHDYNRYASKHQQPTSNYDSFQYVKPQKQTYTKPKYNESVYSESYISDDDPYQESYDRQPPPPQKPHYQHKPRARYPSSNYFQPIQDPLDVWLKDSPNEYIQHGIPPQTSSTTNSINDMQAFDLGSLINRIQQDYMDNVRPYVSSVQYVESNQTLANIGLLTSPPNRKDYSIRPNDLYHRRMQSSSYEVINADGHYPYEKRYSKYNPNQYSSMQRKRHRTRLQDQGSSPIRIQETKPKQESPPPPPPPPPKVPTPVASSSSEEEEETATESEEEESPVVPVTVTKPPQPAPITNVIVTPPRNEVNRVPPKPKESETEESESEESKSESETESEEDKPKVPPTRSNIAQATPATPQTNARVMAQRATTADNTTNDPPEVYDDTSTSFDVQGSGKSSIGNKFRSMKNKLLGR